jgi:hypothetical protein
MEIERSHRRVVIVETATPGSALIFGVGGLAILVASRNMVGVAPALGLGCMALYAAVGSTFIADRDRRALVVRRRIGLWTIEKVYAANTIDRVYERRMGRGSGLAVRFKSGRSKNLMMSFDATAGLDAIAGALNHFLYTPHCG